MTTINTSRDVPKKFVLLASRLSQRIMALSIQIDDQEIARMDCEYSGRTRELCVRARPYLTVPESDSDFPNCFLIDLYIRLDRSTAPFLLASLRNELEAWLKAGTPVDLEHINNTALSALNEISGDD